MLEKTDKMRIKKFSEENSDTKELIHKMQEENQFIISQISHEIRNPVTLINSSLQLIEKQHPEVKDFELWEQTMDDMKYLRNLLDELSHYNNGMRLNRSLICTEDFLRELTASADAWGLEQNSHITLECEDNLPDIEADSVKLRQALINLLKNALESAETSVEIKMYAKRAVDNGRAYVKIVIADNGAGIPAEYLPNLFEPFVTHKQNGTGLGLAITKRIIEAHEGSITVESSPEAGTQFTVLMPDCKGTLLAAP